MRCLITGAFGFIGRNLVDACFEQSIDAVATDIRMPDGIFMPPNAQAQLVDFRDTESMKPLLAGVDTVIHAACTLFPEASNSRIALDAEDNVVATVRLAEACVSAGVRRFVYLSSGGSIYGVTRHVPTDETNATVPECSYGVSKLCVEHYLRLFNKIHGLSHCCVRPSNPYGRYQNPESGNGVIGVFVNRIARGLPVTVWGDGSMQRDFIYSSDLTDAIMSVIRSGIEGPVNIGSGCATSVADIVGMVEDAVGRKAEIEYRPSRPFDVPVSYLDTTVLRNATGWSPAVSLEDGIRFTAAWQRESGLIGGDGL